MTTRTPPLELLVVDDDVVDQRAIARALRAALDIKSIETRDEARSALELLEGRRFDCVVLDYGLPDADGLEVVRTLRARHDAVPIVVLTGGADEAIAVELMKAGASDYLLKANLERVADSVRGAVRLHAAQREAQRARRERDAERDLLRAVLEQMPAGVVVAAPDGELLLYNERLRQLLGALPALGAPGAPRSARDLGRFVLLGDAAESSLPLAAVLEGGVRVEGEERESEGDDGARLVVQVSAAPVQGGAGELVAGVMSIADVTELRQAEERARRAIEARDDLLAIVSHDLRNPLNAIAMAAELLEDDDVARRAGVDPRKTLRRAARRADRLIGDLLDAASIEAGTLSLLRSDVDVAALVDQVHAELLALAEPRGVALAVHVSDAIPAVRADADRIAQVLANLGRNAIEHSPRGATVSIRVVSDPPGVRFCVSDQGEGIAADQLPHVFDRYYQAKRHKRAGAGLGLSIVRGIIDAHGSEIALASTVGEGSRFSFVLPAASPI
ncbi:MAG: response regulator [Myxococcales bacterium]|nr:response regulator [Myxococcales bacterium]